eukprot:1028547-Rhodomonas_salina.2
MTLRLLLFAPLHFPLQCHQHRRHSTRINTDADTCHRSQRPLNFTRGLPSKNFPDPDAFESVSRAVRMLEDKGRLCCYHLPRIVLRVRYALCGTEIGYAATRSLLPALQQVRGEEGGGRREDCLLYTSPSPRDRG